MPIDKLNMHYSFTNPASVHDEEALTALELAGRQGAKINEVIEDQNKLREETENHLDQQDENINDIRTSTVPREIDAGIKNYIEHGYFAGAINEYVGDLEARVNNIMENVDGGSTTLDAEVIDTRVDAFRVAHPSGGSAIRGTSGYLLKALEGIADPVITPMETEQNSGYANKQGVVTPSAEGSNYVYVALDVTPGEIYQITSKYGGIMPNACGYDVDDNYMLTFHIKSDYNVQTDTVIIPEGCVKIRVNSILGDYLAVRRVDKFTLDGAVPRDILENLITANAVEFASPVEPFESLTGVTIDAYGNIKETDTASDYWQVRKFKPTPGVYYKVVAATGYYNMCYVIRDPAGLILEKGEIYKAQTDTDPIIKTFEYSIYATEAVGEIWVGYMKGEGGQLLTLSHPRVPDKAKWAHLKWACVGDSLTQRNQRSDHYYYDYVVDRTGINVTIMGQGGSGYKDREDENYAFYQRVSSIPADTDVVTIFGSGNDLSHISVLGEITDTGTDTLCGCINTTIDNIYAILPTVQLGIVAPTPWINNTPADNQSMARYVEKMAGICQNRGIPFLDLFHGSGLRPNDETFRTLAYSKDDGSGVHPDETGHKMISSHFMRFLESLISTY